MDRRSFVTAAALAPLAACAATPAVAQTLLCAPVEETPFMQAYARYVAARDALNNQPKGISVEDSFAIEEEGSVANMGHGRAASPSWGIRQHWRNAY